MEPPAGELDPHTAPRLLAAVFVSTKYLTSRLSSASCASLPPVTGNASVIFSSTMSRKNLPDSRNTAKSLHHTVLMLSSSPKMLRTETTSCSLKEPTHFYWILTSVATPT